MYSPLYYSSSSLLPRASVTAGSPSELKSAGDCRDYGAQVISARSSQPLDTALIGAQPRPNTGGDPVEARSPAFRHYVTFQPWSGYKYSVHQILCHSSLRSSHQPSVSLFPLASPRRLLECNATSVWKTSIRWNIYHSPSQSFVSGTRKLEDYHDTLLRTRSTRQ